MLFNSLDFAIFLPIVLILHWLLGRNNKGIQNAILVIASYIFYGWWDYRFLTLILFSTLLDYVLGLQMNANQNSNKRKLLLGISIICNLGLLGFFKYYNFFIESFTDAFTLFGGDI
ncbi:MAG: MBOAT family protein, partial [Bacteroidetes bacterium]|nr:MBOAT family protein [Bacteroidota bacterium]